MVQVSARNLCDAVEELAKTNGCLPCAPDFNKSLQSLSHNESRRVSWLVLLSSVASCTFSMSNYHLWIIVRTVIVADDQLRPVLIYTLTV